MQVVGTCAARAAPAAHRGGPASQHPAGSAAPAPALTPNRIILLHPSPRRSIHPLPTVPGRGPRRGPQLPHPRPLRAAPPRHRPSPLRQGFRPASAREVRRHRRGCAPRPPARRHTASRTAAVPVSYTRSGPTKLEVAQRRRVHVDRPSKYCSSNPHFGAACTWVDVDARMNSGRPLIGPPCGVGGGRGVGGEDSPQRAARTHVPARSNGPVAALKHRFHLHAPKRAAAVPEAVPEAVPRPRPRLAQVHEKSKRDLAVVSAPLPRCRVAGGDGWPAGSSW